MPSLSASPSSIAPSGTATVVAADGPANTTDWVGLYDTGAADDVFLDWFYLNNLKTAPGAGVSGATLTFTMPSTLGTYDFRFFPNDLTTPRLAISNVVTVEVQAASSVWQRTGGGYFVS